MSRLTAGQTAALRGIARDGRGGLSSVSSLSSTANWPAPLSTAALHGLAGEIARAIEPHSEADPAVLLVNTLVAFGSACGRGPGFDIGGTFHATNIFALTVGPTSAARKGTGWDAIKAVFATADVEWTRERVQSGLSSGEGLIHAVRDAQVKQVPAKENGKPTGEYLEEIEDHGVQDKRLLAREGEFASVLRVMRRDGNTLSTTVRSLWDGGDVRTLTKGKPERATGAHVSVIGDITPEELRRELDDTSAANGFVNRFLIVCAKRSKMLPVGGSPDRATLDRLADAVRTSLRFAEVQTSIPMDRQAEALWSEQYPGLTTGRPGLLGAVIGRAAPQVRRLATIYALMDTSEKVREADLLAALALWRYCEDSARYVFGERLGDNIGDRLLEALRDSESDGLTRSDMRELLGNRVPGERIDTALALLRELGLARAEREQTGGRPAERWYAVEITERTEESLDARLAPRAPAPRAPAPRSPATDDLRRRIRSLTTMGENDAEAEWSRLVADYGPTPGDSAEAKMRRARC
jgi:hypothetical protein